MRDQGDLSECSNGADNHNLKSFRPRIHIAGGAANQLETSGPNVASILVWEFSTLFSAETTNKHYYA